ncbi:MAG: DUF2892 domain-containing protein [Ignavibacteriaceae bacterium]|nr:DUF2892 domain-containing protein [Ignavibacteriaceae bacterium]
MKENVGGFDRILRLVVGVGLVGWGIYAQNWIGLLGLIPIVTATVKSCPLYLPFGLSTCKTETAEK